MTRLKRYTLRLTNGETVHIEAPPGRVFHGDHGINVYDPTNQKRQFFPWVNVLEEKSEWVEWEAVS